MAGGSRKVFIDSSVMLAFVDRADDNHQKAVRIFENLAKFGLVVYTSYQNVADTYAALGREIGVSIGLEFLQSAIKSDIEILFPQKADLITAHRMLRSNREKQVSLKEALNATLMQRKDISQVVTFTYWHSLFGTYVSNLSA